MAIPNTTPTPNELFNGEMKKMSDTELRVVLIVTRATLGWEIDRETKMRKTEDWISHKQLIDKTGKSSRSISYAIDSCVKNGWIETRNQEGKILKTAQDRKLLGKKIFYRLGSIFLNTIATDTKVEKPSQLKTKTIAKNDKKPSQQLRTTKEIHTKENNTKAIATDVAKQINPLIEKFENVNPSFATLFKLKGQRDAMERLVKKYGYEKVGRMIDYLPTILGKKFAPVITTPYQLEAKLGQLVAYAKKNNKNYIKIS